MAPPHSSLIFPAHGVLQLSIPKVVGALIQFDSVEKIPPQKH